MSNDYFTCVDCNRTYPVEERSEPGSVICKDCDSFIGHPVWGRSE